MCEDGADHIIERAKTGKFFSILGNPKMATLVSMPGLSVEIISGIK